MTTENLHRIFQPRSVAVIGASSRQGSVGAALMENLTGGGFKGDVFPVNPAHGRILGIPAQPKVTKIRPDVDLAVIAVPIRAVPGVLADCGQKGIPGAVIISAGNPAPDKDGRVYDRIAAISRDTGMRIIGPDSVGVVSCLDHFNASFMHRPPLPGSIAFLSQSGAVCTSVLDLALRENVGFSHFVSLGSKLDVDFSDMLDYLGSLPEVTSILMYVESLTRMRRFMSAARAVSRVKPIIALKPGRAGRIRDLCEDEIYEAAFQRAGILRVSEFEAFFDCAEFLAKQQRPRGPRIAILSNAGGISALAVDALADRGLKPAALAQETLERLDGFLGDTWSRANPIELIRASTPENYLEAVKTCLRASEIDGLLLLSSPVGTFDCTAVAGPLAELLRAAPFPVVTAWLGGMNIDESRALLNRNGIITYDTPERAVRAFVNLFRYGRNMELLQEIPLRTDKRLNIDWDRSAGIIESCLAAGQDRLSGEQARALAAAFGIETDCRAAAALPDYSLAVSAVNDDLFGPVIRFGLGGPMTDVIRDMAMALPPLNRLLARRAIESTRVSEVIRGAGRFKAADMGLLEELMIRVSRMVAEYPAIRRLDLNPVQVTDGRIVVADGDVRISPTDRSPSSHLIISPYPWWQEADFTTRDGETIFMRPVRPGDAGQMIDLFYQLSPETVYRRFFSPMKTISKSLLIKLSQIDYDREIALCAFSGQGKDRRMIGVARIIFMPDGKNGEFAVVLADDWQAKGIGAVLLGRALAGARKYGLSRVGSPVIRTNAGMLKLGEKLGFGVALDPDSGEYRLSIDLGTLEPA